MRGMNRLLACVGVGLALCGVARAQQVLISDDFSAPALKEIWIQDYPEPPMVMKVVNGELDTGLATCWHAGAKTFNVADYPSGLSLSADMRIYPRPGWGWKVSSEFHPFGFQDKTGGVGAVYLRFSFKDANNDNMADTIQFQTRDAEGNRFVTAIPDYNPSTDTKSHNFRIDWRSNRAEAYFDGKLIATHTIHIAQPLWVVGRNELGGTILDNFELKVLPAQEKAQ